MDDETVPFVINAAFNIPLSLLAVTGNSLILASFASNPSLISPFTFLICLSLTDLCVGLFVQPLYIAWRLFFNHSSTSGTFLLLVILFSGILCSFSLLSVTSLSVDRFLALHLHLRYKQLITVRRVAWFLVLLCFSSVLICSVSMWFPSYDEMAGRVMALACFMIRPTLGPKVAQSHLKSPKVA